MKNVTTERGFQVVTHDTYANKPEDARLVQQSSAIGDYPDSFDRPGSSFLWFGDRHHLNREEVAALVGYLNHWLATGVLFPRESKVEDK